MRHRPALLCGFDEIKANGAGVATPRYTTQGIELCALSARAVASIYNWWSWYVRLVSPKSRLGAKTSRPQLLSALGHLTTQGRINKIVLALTHDVATPLCQTSCRLTKKRGCSVSERYL